jgi:hypothetical protein
MISKSYRKLIGSCLPLSTEENELLLRLYAKSRDQEVIWKLVSHNLIWIYGLLSKKYSQEYLSDEIFSDAISAFYRSVTFYKDCFNYYQFRKMATKAIIGITGNNSHKRKIQMSGNFKHNDKIMASQESKDRTYWGVDKTGVYTGDSLRETDSEDPFENVANKDLSDFCCKVMRGNKLYNSLTPPQKRGLYALLNGRNDAHAAEIMGVSRQRIVSIKQEMKDKIRRAFRMNDGEIHLLLS